MKTGAIYRLRVILPALMLLSACTFEENDSAGITADWELNGFVKVDSLNPVLQPSAEPFFTDPITGRAVHWEARNVLNPAAVVRNDTVYLFYRAQDSTGTSRIGLAYSIDGLHFTKYGAPVFYPDTDSMKSREWSYIKNTNPECRNCFDGVEDPRIVESEDGRYILTYTAYDGKTARLALAVSDDLRHWEKKGLVLSDSAFRNTWSKSGAIVTKRSDSRIIATRVNGRYWMYYGDTDLFMAYSDDLIHWKPLLNEENGRRVRVMHPRPGYFDSRLTEPGPYALMRNEGILLLYNGSNAANAGDPDLPRFTYAAGQALFSSEAPYKLIDRSDDYFIHPEKSYEISGEVNLVCFIEGLVCFRNHWFLYYGTADSRIAVATAPCY